MGASVVVGDVLLEALRGRFVKLERIGLAYTRLLLSEKRSSFTKAWGLNRETAAAQ